MSFFQKARLFFKLFLQFLFRFSSQTISDVSRSLSAFETIELAKGPMGLHFHIPKARVTLTSFGPGDVQSMTLSVDEAAQIFQSIKRACDLSELQEIKVGELSWKTDARPRANPDEIIIVFNGPLGYTRQPVKQEDAEAAVAAFTNRFEQRNSL